LPQFLEALSRAISRSRSATFGKRAKVLPAAFLSRRTAVTWNNGGSVLYGQILDTREGTTALYSTMVIPAGTWDFVHTDSVGGSGFFPLSLLDFAKHVRDAVRVEDDGDDGGAE
jgi:hypothetical protein